ncbi:sensor histidine kinase [Pinibacter aurantiacus]|uniref:histidine kinase n=1 Tax=Pinibacter aurantiacus TaxID=2851599 RepID=A0A9E2S573_9BACT|nr:ATP-binding protein [Pinibacter aurantiacus]MBV4355842.1 PAS domain S-box protein [Pinibacter aurantiacus]
MIELTKVILENEMDLILAHKQSMRLAELTGLSLASQTTFATAVSEVSRSSIGNNITTTLTLYVSGKKEQPKFIYAVLEDDRQNFSELKDEGYKYAKKLVSNISVSTSDAGTRIELKFRLAQNIRIDDFIIEKWTIQFNNDPGISPYEEIKRKNRQLIELADRLRESEEQYRSLTDSLPIMIFSLNRKGALTFANKWVESYTGSTIENINNNQWQSILHPEDLAKTWENWKTNAESPDAIVVPEQRVKDIRTGEYRWHTGVSIAIVNENGSVMSRNNFLVDIHAQKLIEQTLKDNLELKQTKAELEEYIALLNQSNKQLEQFAYITSHDLQEPLRKISFYSDLLGHKFRHAIPPEALVFFENLIGASDRMRLLVKDVLSYSTMQKNEFDDLDLNVIAAEIIQDLEIAITEKNALITISELPVIQGNSRQIKQLFENLLSNALKFTRADQSPIVTINAVVTADVATIIVLDNGIGFEEVYVEKMFDLFQQLHPKGRYKGTGIGLALCKRIVDLHKGSIKAEGKLGEGAVFEIKLPLTQN